MDRVTFATASGMALVALTFHFAAGLASIGAGVIALAARKGGALHKRSGMVFTIGMLVLGLTAAGIGAYEGAPGQVVAGLFAVYFVFTAMTTVKPLPGLGPRLDAVLMLVAFALAALMLRAALLEWLDPAVPVVGRPRVGPPLIGGMLLLLAAVGDLRVARAGGGATLRGPRRLARHLWRMCFGLFIATGSFFLGQMAFVPDSVRVLPVLLVLAFAPLALLAYWMWRVRVRASLKGIIVGSAASP
ncbi:MAG: hypothetical protein KJZ74_01205 [Gemmatimonadales bacterium]|nr:hypothetical protein [Gemmatimonadota bacterium]MCL4212507.1 hypothetical protein [Gemmatimonadales bacterium]